MFVLSVSQVAVNDQPVQLIVEAPRVTTLVLDPAEANVPQVTVLPFVSNVPLVTEIIEAQLLNVSCNVHHQPTPLKSITEAKVVPARVTVLPVAVELNVKAPVYVRINPLYNVILPEIVIATDQAHVTLPVNGAQNVISRHSFVVASIVTV